MKRLPWCWWLLCCAIPIAIFAPTPAAAQAGASDSVRQEARERFDRGLELFNQGDNSGALAEFERAYELIPHPLVLYNIGLVHAASRQAVEAVDAFDRLLRDPGGLDADRLAMAKKTRNEMDARIGQVMVTASVDGAAIELDNVGVAKTPLDAPLKVASGDHIIGVVAPGFLPVRRRVTVAGKSRVDIDFQLMPLEGRLASIQVETNVPGVEVHVDGDLVGRTPLPATLALAPGNHSLELSRDGYVPERRDLNLGEGSTGEVTVEMRVDGAAVQRRGATLSLDVSESDPVVLVDGRPVGGKTLLRVPPGRHRVRVERADFFPVERDVDLAPNDRVTVPVALEPTADYRARYHAKEQRKRTWAWVATGAGLGLIGGGAGFLIWNKGEKNSARNKFDEVADSRENMGRCDPAIGLSTREDAACRAELDIALDNIDKADARDKWGAIGIGVGAASVVTGAILFIIGDNPDKYEPTDESDVFARRPHMVPDAWVGPEGAGLGVRGWF